MIARVTVGVLLLVIAACGSSKTSSSSPPPAPRDVSLPDLARMDPSVQAQVKQRYVTLMEKRKAGASGDDLGSAYGEYGMLLHAAEYHEAAEPAYLNAQDLMPGDVRWPYYLGHLYKSIGQTQKSIDAFTRALDRSPSEIAALVWLGRLYLEQGKPDEAEGFFTRAADLPPRNVAVLAGLGQTALAKRDYTKAASMLEDALALDSNAASIHSPLANAYRGLGDEAKAEAHLKQWRNTEILVPDRLRMDLDLSLESGLSYELRGVRALEARDFAAAEGFFRKGVELTPTTTALGRSLRHKLGTALILQGDTAGAMARFEEVAKLAPAEGLDEASAKANYSLGVVMASSGRMSEAVQRFTLAVKYNPNYAEALMALGDTLRRVGRFDASLKPYADVVRINPRATDARFGYAMALVRLRRYRDARDWLDEGARVQPDRAELSHALARVLAAAPDEGVRDGARAMALVQELMKGTKTTVLGETLAMAMAELGQFRDAVDVQRGVMASARQAGLERDVLRMTDNLRRYERGQACRVPWPDDDPAHIPAMFASAPPG
ncbi:MAG: tetratricopeptide repeat protein, partial [Candidatus Rokuibacteriota bacterium]